MRRFRSHSLDEDEDEDEGERAETTATFFSLSLLSLASVLTRRHRHSIHCSLSHRSPEKHKHFITVSRGYSVRGSRAESSLSRSL